MCSFCDHIHMFTKVVIGVIAIANAIAAAVLAALGLLGLLALLAASIFDLFNAMMSGGLNRGRCRRRGYRPGFLQSASDPPGFPANGAVRLEAARGDEKKKEKEKRQDLYCGDGDGYMPKRT